MTMRPHVTVRSTERKTTNPDECARIQKTQNDTGESTYSAFQNKRNRRMSYTPLEINGASLGQGNMGSRFAPSLFRYDAFIKQHN